MRELRYGILAAKIGVLLSLIIIYSVVGSRSALASPSDLRLTLTTDKQNYYPSEPINITLLLKNVGAESVTLHFASACQAFFMVQNASRATIYDQSRGVICLQMVTQLTIAAGASFPYVFRWSQVNETSYPLTLYGYFTIIGWIPSSETFLQASTSISILGTLTAFGGSPQIVTTLIAVVTSYFLLIFRRRLSDWH